MFPFKEQEPSIVPSFQDREEIHNIWDSHTHLLEARENLASPTQAIIVDIEQKGFELLDSTDPYKVKLGIQMLRTCIWHDTQLAQDWIKVHSKSLLEHSNPRVRHSALWNIRASVWQNPEFADQVKEIARTKLIDSDPAVQRVAVWVLGDSVVNDPKLFNSANMSVFNYLTSSDKESSTLFALEEFYMPLRSIFSREAGYLESISQIKALNNYNIGIKARCANALGESFQITWEDRDALKNRLMGVFRESEIGDYLENEKFTVALQRLNTDLKSTLMFNTGMKNLWLVKDLLWLSDSNSIGTYLFLKEFALKNTDGDFTRTISVVLSDCTYQNTEIIAPYAIKFVEEFFKINDNDGSQIVMAQTLSSLRNYSLYTNYLLKIILPELIKTAANKSVISSLEKLV
jgi:hypothetical protein